MYFCNMSGTDKKRQLQHHKKIATGLFLFMACLFLLSEILIQKRYQWISLPYIKAFSEAAMVGALADWFAVTALFHYPLGIKIPHTNLIQKSQERIGNNLGNFIVENFLSFSTLKTYLRKFKLSARIEEIAGNEKYQNLLLKFIASQLEKLITNQKPEELSKWVQETLLNEVQNARISSLVSDVGTFALSQGFLEKSMEKIAQYCEAYIEEHPEFVQARVRKESYAFIPKFIDDGVAKKITVALLTFFKEIGSTGPHPLKQEILLRADSFLLELKTSPNKEASLQNLAYQLLQSNATKGSLEKAMLRFHQVLLHQIQNEDSQIIQKLRSSLQIAVSEFGKNTELKEKLDNQFRTSVLKIVIEYRQKIADAIGKTVASWEGKELSEKLELEVGKDLQFIRINGTLVGGLVGLAIYTASKLLFYIL